MPKVDLSLTVWFDLALRFKFLNRSWLLVVCLTVALGFRRAKNSPLADFGYLLTTWWLIRCCSIAILWKVKTIWSRLIAKMSVQSPGASN